MANSQLLEMQARERAGMPDTWRIFRWECFPKTFRPEDVIYIELSGAVVPPKLAGKYKGQPNWRRRDRSTERTIVITIPDANKWASEWSARTGKCDNCTGSGKVFHSWNHETGTTYKTCRMCEGSGLQPPRSAVE